MTDQPRLWPALAALVVFVTSVFGGGGVSAGGMVVNAGFATIVFFIVQGVLGDRSGESAAEAAASDAE